MVTALAHDRLTIVRGVEASMAAYWLALGRGARGYVYDEPDLQWAYTGTPVLNRVVGARLDGGEADARIADVVAWFRACNASVAWLVGPSTFPPDLGRRLQAHGFTYEGDWLGMAAAVRGAGGPVGRRPGLVVREARGGDLLRRWLQIIGTGFDLPPAARDTFRRLAADARGDAAGPWHRYVGFWHGRPVSTATLFTGAGVAGVYLVTTLPEARRQGLATALTQHVLAEARARGYRFAVLQATPAAQGLYRRLGFDEHCRIGVYRWEPAGRLGWRGRLATGLATGRRRLGRLRARWVHAGGHLAGA